MPILRGYYHNDHLGTPQEMLNTEGEVVWSARYQAYGKAVGFDVQQIENPLRFPGQYYDTETGLHYNRHRYYHPGVGRFVCQDPIGLEGGANLYQYAPNPLGWTDPLGLSPDPNDCPPGGSKSKLSIKQQALELKKLNTNKNSVKVNSPGKITHYDLDGASHKSVETPHVQHSYKNTNSETGETFFNKDRGAIPNKMTQQDIRTVRKILERRNH